MTCSWGIYSKTLHNIKEASMLTGAKIKVFSRMNCCLEAAVFIWRSLPTLFLLMAEFSSQDHRTEAPVSLLAVDWRPEYSLEVLMLKLKLQHFDHMMQKADSLEKTLMLGKIKGRRRGSERGWDAWMVSLTQWTWVWASSGSWWWTGKPGVLQSMGSQGVGHDWATELTDGGR